ncbi:hypothetical protein MRX96_035342 [Rhipicephalus microplus]
MQCFAGLVDLNFWDVTSPDTGSHGSAQSFLAGHVNVTECLPWDCHISPLWNGACASAFKLPQFNDRGHPLLDQPFVDNCGTVTSFTTRTRLRIRKREGGKPNLEVRKTMRVSPVSNKRTQQDIIRITITD